MATPKQIAANRRNAQKSTGPCTPEGKAAVRFNAVKHGLTAGRLVVYGEDGAELEGLAKSLARELRPVGRLEKFVFQQIVIDAWRLRRTRYLESGLCNLEIMDRQPGIERRLGELPDPQPLAHCLRGQLTDPGPLSSLSRYQTRIERSFYRALHELRRLQAQRNATPTPPPSNTPRPVLNETKNAEQTQSENDARSATDPERFPAPSPQPPAPSR